MRSGQARSREDQPLLKDGLGRSSIVVGRVIVVSMIAFLCCGCSGDAEVDSGGGTVETAANRKRRRSDVLKTLIDMSEPQTLRIRTRRETVVSLLNDWVSMSGEGVEAGDDRESIDEAYVGRLDKDLIARVRASRFSTRDVTHIRDALWYARISKLVAAPAKTDLERSNRLFYYVMRNIVLRTDEDTQLPMAPFGIGMFGEGNSRDRSWLFINLLGQLRIDAVILQAGDSPSRVLVGVLLDGKVYLYDPVLGLPVPAGPATEAAAVISRPATLADVTRDPSLLSSLGEPKVSPYPFTAASLAEVRVSLVGASSFWAPRMRRLQLALSSANDVLLWHPLEADEIVPEGALARVAKVEVKGFEEAAIAIWDYPEERLDGNSSFTTQQLQVFLLRSRAFESPIPIMQILTNRETREIQLQVAERGQFRHRMARNRQLLGEWKTAVTTFLKVRMWRDVPPLPKEVGFINRREQAGFKALLPTRMRLVHEEAADDAAFWTAVCQYEQGQVESAADALREYRNRSGPHEWKSGAMWLEGLWRGELGQWAQAVAVLEMITELDPHRAGAHVLLMRWKPLATAAPKPDPSKAATPAAKE